MEICHTGKMGLMIKNERQYAITKTQVEKFARALERLTSQPDKARRVHPLLRKAEADAIRSQLADFRAELKEYEALSSGRGGFPRISTMSELSRVIIRARIVSGLSQKELAERLGLKEQQIQRYEATDYASASLSRLIEVSRAVGLENPKEGRSLLRGRKNGNLPGRRARITKIRRSKMKCGEMKPRAATASWLAPLAVLISDF
jgi:transcriptional regulator with XRE-family HTH domain